jgi:3-phenylpropionate/cinnamic acid dioxygenase small subunit
MSVTPLNARDRGRDFLIAALLAVLAVVIVVSIYHTNSVKSDLIETREDLDRERSLSLILLQERQELLDRIDRFSNGTASKQD